MGSLIGRALAARGPAPSSPPVPVGAADLGVSRLPGLVGGVSQDAAYLRAYKSQGTVHANVALLAQSTAAPVWQLFRSQQDGRVRYTTSDQGSDQRVEVIRHAALSLLQKPNPFWTRHRLFELSQIWLDLTGKSYWVIDRRGGVPAGIWPVRPDRMVPVPDPDLYLKGYVYRSPDGRELIPLDVRDVVFNCLPDPEDPYGGAGPVQAVLTEIDGARYASEWNRNFFANSARPDGVIQVDKRLSDEEWDELTDRWREAHRGVARAHRVAVLEAGATWQATSTNPKDMDFGNLLSTGADRIREAWGMHKVMTGVTEDVNRANAQTGEEIFAIWQVTPRLQRWRDVLNHQYLPMFGATGEGVEFDFVFPMPTNREQDALELTTKSTAASVLVNAGYDPHDVLQTVGLPDMNVVEQATQQPALPPGWVAPMGAPGGGAPAGPAPDAAAAGMERLRAAAGWDSPAWAGMDAAVRPSRRRHAVTGAAVTPVRGKDTAAKVFTQQAEDYPASAMAWMHHADWKGPVKVPLDHVEPDMQWLDSADPEHVRDFVQRIRQGKKLKPVILVKTPDDPRLKLIDGHHRYLADKQMGLPVRAWIGTVDADHGPWEQMHEYQFHPSAGGEAKAAARMREQAIWNQLAGV